MAELITNQNILTTVAQDMAMANDYLLRTAPDRFNRNLLNLLQQKIQLGKMEAYKHREKVPAARLYVYYTQFPLDVYESLDPLFLRDLEDRGIFIYKKKNMDTAMISITYHF